MGLEPMTFVTLISACRAFHYRQPQWIEDLAKIGWVLLECNMQLAKRLWVRVQVQTILFLFERSIREE